MAPGDAGHAQLERAARAGRRRAAGIYGAIITAAVMAAGGASLAATPLAVSVLITLVVYWLAEQYAELLSEPERQGHLPDWAHVRHTFADRWPMVSASFAPIIALVLARLAGATTPSAATVGVAVAIALLTFHGWSAGRAAQLRGWRLAVATAIAAALGLMIVVLKNVVIHNLH